MIRFKDKSAADKLRARLEQLGHVDLGPLFKSGFVDCADPDKALVNLERWLEATSNSSVYLAHLASAPKMSKLLLAVMGASQPLADALIQNPELGDLILDPANLARPVDPIAVLDEGRRLLSLASGYSHALDRLRFLKQRWTLPLVVGDLSGLWTQEQVWLGLSDIADALIRLASEAAWMEYSAQRGLHAECPVGIVAFGKLGGRELNYSSDVDLVYVQNDDVDDSLERHAIRFSEVLGRALSDHMGRGALFRVDLRLRPFGGAGPVVQRIRAVEAYYRSHAQSWEVQALVRSRLIVGAQRFGERWEAMRTEQCFRAKWAGSAFEEMVATRARVEEFGGSDDLKRGPGGIRDVEFLVQMLQLLHGHRHPSVRVQGTCDALRALAAAEAIPRDAAEELVDSYTFLRMLEHRCQLAGSLQTHEIPSDVEERDRLGRLMGLGGWGRLSVQLETRRKRVRSLYSRWIGQGISEQSPRAAVLAELEPFRKEAETWFDGLPESSAFYGSLAENRDSLRRIRETLEGANSLVPTLRREVALTEALVSGEIEEDFDASARLDTLSVESTPEALARALHSAWTRLALRWSLQPDDGLGERITELYDALIRHVARRLYVGFDVVALGSFGAGECALLSDVDLLLLVPDSAAHSQAEGQAEQLLSLLGALRRYGALLNVDLRLRPEGSQGLLARTYEGFLAYELNEMEMWERFALGEARLVWGNAEAERIVRRAAYAQPLTPERLEELLAMKHRIETERVSAKHFRRHVKLGYGGLGDIDWFVHLHEMRFPTATDAGTRKPFDARLRSLSLAQLIHAVELEALDDGRRHLQRVRNRLTVMGFTPDVVPENPDKLDMLARQFGFAEGNSFLARHESVLDTVRAIYEEGMERLRA